MHYAKTMRLEQPGWLLLIPFILAAGWVAYRFIEMQRASLAFSTLGALGDGGFSQTGQLYRLFPYAARLLALILCAVALARPQSVQRQFGGLTQGIDILLTIDTSTSMFAIDFDPINRIAAAKETAKRFIGGRTNDRIGIVVFGGAPVLACPLTMDYSALLEFLDGIDAGMTQTEGTAVGDGIASAVRHLQSSKAKSKVIILLTDGRSNTGVVDPVTAAKTAETFGIKIYTIGTAKRGEARIPVETPMGRILQRIPDELDEDVLLQVAAATGGKYFRATNTKELRDIYAEIDRLEKSDVGKPMVISYTDFYPWFLIPALLLLALEWTLSRTLLLRIP